MGRSRLARLYLRSPAGSLFESADGDQASEAAAAAAAGEKKKNHSFHLLLKIAQFLSCGRDAFHQRERGRR